MTDIFFTTTRGKLKGRKLRVWQMCNDWVTAYDVELNDHANDGQPLSLHSCHFPFSERGKVIPGNAAKIPCLQTIFSTTFPQSIDLELQRWYYFVIIPV